MIMADTAEVIDSRILGDGTIPRPDTSAVVANASPIPDEEDVVITQSEAAGSFGSIWVVRPLRRISHGLHELVDFVGSLDLRENESHQADIEVLLDPVLFEIVRLHTHANDRCPHRVR